MEGGGSLIYRAHKESIKDNTDKNDEESPGKSYPAPEDNGQVFKEVDFLLLRGSVWAVGVLGIMKILFYLIFTFLIKGKIIEIDILY